MNLEEIKTSWAGIAGPENTMDVRADTKHTGTGMSYAVVVGELWESINVRTATNEEMFTMSLAPTHIDWLIKRVEELEAKLELVEWAEQNR